MNQKTVAISICILLVAIAAIFRVRQNLSHIPIGLAGAQTSGGENGCEVLVSVSRRDPWIGKEHGAPPVLERAWLSDGNGKELSATLLSPMQVPPRDELGGFQFGWRVAKKIPHAPPIVLFHATFVAPNAAPFQFEQNLREGIDFNET